MRVYLASPNTQQQAEHCAGMAVLLSFALFKPWLWQYQPTFGRVLIDSGAFSVLQGGKEIDREAFREFGELWPWDYDEDNRRAATGKLLGNQHNQSVEDRIDQLAVAGALIAAEIDRLLRLKETQ